MLVTAPHSTAMLVESTVFYLTERAVLIAITLDLSKPVKRITFARALGLGRDSVRGRRCRCGGRFRRLRADIMATGLTVTTMFDARHDPTTAPVVLAVFISLMFALCVALARAVLRWGVAPPGGGRRFETVLIGRHSVLIGRHSLHRENEEEGNGEEGCCELHF